MFFAGREIMIGPDVGGVVVVEVPQELDGHGARLRRLVTSKYFGVDLPEVAEDGPLVVEGHGLREAVVKLEEEQDLRLGDLVCVRVDKEVVQANVVQLLQTCFGRPIVVTKTKSVGIFFRNLPQHIQYR